MKRLALQWPVGATLWRALACLLVACAAAEGLARTPAARTIFPIESFGSSHPHFNTQVTRILARAAGGRIDCIFVGDSQVLHDINPGVIEPILSANSGAPVRCQNFGLGGMTTLSAEDVARMLIQRFHPRVLVFGTSELNYVSSGLDASHESIVSSPWLQYELGRRSFDGWLLENSQAYRFYLGTLGMWFDGAPVNAEIQSDGHSIQFAGHTGMSIPQQVEYFRGLYKKPELSPSHVDGLRRMLALQSPQTRLVVLEMPIDPQYFQFNRGLAALYPQVRQILVSETAATGIPLWLTQWELEIPVDGWYDLIHLGRLGNATLSRMAAERLSAMLGTQASSP
jgi:hypothetical protein